MAVARELQRTGTYTASVYLATGLPITWVRTQRNSFKAYLMKIRLWISDTTAMIFILSLLGAAFIRNATPLLLSISTNLREQIFLPTSVTVQ